MMDCGTKIPGVQPWSYNDDAHVLKANGKGMETHILEIVWLRADKRSAFFFSKPPTNEVSPIWDHNTALVRIVGNN